MVISKNDRKMFELATHDVRPIKTTDRVVPRTSKPSAHARLSRAADLETLEESLNGESADPAEEVGFRRPGLSDRDFRRLRQGRFSIEDEIDLHGLNRAQARAALRAFLGDAIDRRLGCVRVIHGKGSRSGPHGPVLKSRVHYWLSQWDEVLAFVSARRRHGGSGAVYVLLR